MGDLTRNQSRHEYACSCGCGLAAPHPWLLDSVQRLVDDSGARIVLITSGSRCPEYNAKLVRLGMAAPGSKHQPDTGGYTLAADIVLVGVPLLTAVDTALSLPRFAHGGVGLYYGNTTERLHVDVRGYPARWAIVDGHGVTFDAALRKLEVRT